MQAIRVDRRRAPEVRWPQHLAVLSTLGLLFVWVVGGQPGAVVPFVERLPSRFLAPPSAPAQDWMTVRVPVRTTVAVAPDPRVAQVTRGDAEVAEVLVTVGASEAIASAPVRGAEAAWVRAQQKTRLFAAPDAGAVTERDVPQSSYLRVLEAHDDWLRVSYAGDGSDRAASTAWVHREAEAISAVDAPRYVTSTRNAQLWGSSSGDDHVAFVPRLATLELADVERNGRVGVRVQTPDKSESMLAWVDWEVVAGSRAPAERDLPSQRSFSPFANDVRLDVPYRTQLDGSISAAANCGPASVAMSMGSFGIGVPTAQVRSLTSRFMGSWDPFSGTTLESLRDVAQSYGLQGLDLKENGRYKRWTPDDIRAHLRAGHPVIPQLRYRLMPGREWVWVTYDHYVTITGFVGDEFIFNDPISLNGKGERTMTTQQLLRAWMNSDAPGAALAVARPLY